MSKSEGIGAKRVACVGDDDPAYLDRFVRALQERGLSARHISVFGLKIAPRPPDLTVILGKATEDGGATVVRTVGEERGPFVIVLSPGALAVRLEARQRGLHVVPRKDDGGETAALIVDLLEDIVEGKVSSPTPSTPAPSIALDGLDWDDEPETVNQPREPMLTAGRGLPRMPAIPPPRQQGDRTTLPGGLSSSSSKGPDVALSFDDVTQSESLRDIHRDITKPTHIDPREIDPHGATTKSLQMPADDDFGYETLAEEADADVTAPHPVLSSPNPDRTAPQKAPWLRAGKKKQSFASTLMGISPVDAAEKLPRDRARERRRRWPRRPRRADQAASSRRPRRADQAPAQR